MLHEQLKEWIEENFSGSLAEDVQLCQDAILVRLINEVDVEIRYRNGHEYSMCWRWGDAMMRIDTAHLHPQPGTYPSHFHDAAEQVRPEPVSQPGAFPSDNVRKLLERLLAAPLLDTRLAA